MCLKIPYGKKVTSLLTVTNESQSTRTVMVTMVMYVVRYDGIKQDKVTDYEEQLKIEENNCKIYNLVLFN